MPAPVILKKKLSIRMILISILILALFVFGIAVIDGYLGLKNEGIRKADILLCFTNRDAGCWEKCDANYVPKHINSMMYPFDTGCKTVKERLNIYYLKRALAERNPLLCDNVYEDANPKVNRFESFKSACLRAIEEAKTADKSRNSDFLTK